MSPHHRFQSFMRFQSVDRPPLLEWGTWEATVQAWMRETGKDREYVLQWQQECDAQVLPGIDFSMIPPFEEEVLSEDDVSLTRHDRMGQTFREFKQNPETSMPEFIEAPVTTQQDWESIKRRFDPTIPERYPVDWAERVARWNREKPILRLYGLVATYYGGPSLFGFCRMLLGDERVLYAFHDEPLMIEDMMETATEFAISVFRKALTEAPVTLAQFWEDMCYREGPLISPALVKKLTVPRYRRIAQTLRDAGVDIIFVDSDGDVSQLIPL